MAAEPLPGLHFRSAQLTDLDSLIELETTCFRGDRLSRRSFRHWIKAPHAILLLARHEQSLIAYGLVWCYTRSDIARLYSLAVLPQWRGLGVAEQLLSQLEQLSLERGYCCLRLEVAKSNQAATTLYQSRGYRVFGEYADYYADHDTALRMQKALGQMV